ncbi:MAG: hypothetical protein HPY85_08995 [Anaerolineae bacterium]|nr:hypothetical protein [Anaerolineae bacterium]
MAFRWAIVMMTILAWMAAGCARQAEIPPADVHSESGGFSLVSIPGYTVTHIPNGVTLYPDPYDPASGPGMVLVVTALEAPVDLEQAAVVAQKRYSADGLSTPTTINIDGQPGLQMDFTNEYHADDGVVRDFYGAGEGETIRGRLVLVLLDPQTLFEARMLAPEQQWKKMIPLYTTVIESLQFNAAED